MNINFKGYQNTGYLIVTKPKSKQILSNCVWTDFNNIGRRDHENSQELLKDFPSKNGAIFVSVDSKNVPLKDSTIKINNVLLKFRDKDLGKISKISKFLKKIVETKDELFSLDLNQLHKFKQHIKKDPNAPKRLKETSEYKIFNAQNAKKVAKKMFEAINNKMTEYVTVKR